MKQQNLKQILGEFSGLKFDVADVFEQIAHVVIERDTKVRIERFGIFYLGRTKRRVIRDPQTGELVALAPTRRLAFRASKHNKFTEAE